MRWGGGGGVGVPGSYAACAHSLCLPHFVCEHAATLNRTLPSTLPRAARIDIFAKVARSRPTVSTV